MDSNTLQDEHRLLSRVIDGDKVAFLLMFRKFTPQLAAFASGLFKSEEVTEEIIQETFARLWMTREQITINDDPKSLIFRMASIVSYSFLPQLSSETNPVNKVLHESYYGNDEVIEPARLYNLVAAMHEGVRELTPEQKIVYRMSREKGMKISEIADELSLSPNNVRNLLNSALESVRDYIQDKGLRL